LTRRVFQKTLRRPDFLENQAPGAAAKLRARGAHSGASVAGPGAYRLARVIGFLAAAVSLAACSSQPEPKPVALYPGETPGIRMLINEYADHYEVPRELVHKVVQRESDYRPAARNGPYYGMMQILPATARGMGFQGQPSDLLDAETNLNYAVKYLRGAWLVSDGDMDEAVMWYARGYYYEARDRCMLVATGLREREVARDCRADATAAPLVSRRG
jgi:soluble lytic murein transglycosylase-like protein